MEDGLIKTTALGMLSAIVSKLHIGVLAQATITEQVEAYTIVDQFVHFLQGGFYLYGIYVFHTSARDWHRKRKNYKAWKAGNFKPEEKDKYEIR